MFYLFSFFENIIKFVQLIIKNIFFEKTKRNEKSRKGKRNIIKKDKGKKIRWRNEFWNDAKKCKINIRK